jgi:hypothetical protein
MNLQKKMVINNVTYQNFPISIISPPVLPIPPWGIPHVPPVTIDEMVLGVFLLQRPKKMLRKINYDDNIILGESRDLYNHLFHFLYI